MDLFASLVENKESAPEKLKVRRVYINEDPNVEETMSCPKCWSQNRHSTVRYMFVNLQEAIFKCEAASCMYPFRDFKFKNYADKTVYYYTSTTDDTQSTIIGFGSTFPNVTSPSKSTHQMQQSRGNPLIDFNLDFLSPVRTHVAANQATKSPEGNDVNIFGSPSLAYKNLVKDFDTDFIDDILQDLGQAPSPVKIPVLDARVSPQKKATPTNRQLKRCLEMFQQSKISDTKTDGVFKVPPIPGSEVPNSPKHMLKKTSPPKRHKHTRPKHHTPVPSAEKVLKKCQMKPLQFLESLNSIQLPESSRNEGNPETPRMSGGQRLGNQKVERMLNFIERSMKNRVPKVETANAQPESQTKRFVPEPPIRRKRKEHRKMSLSAAVLHDSDFEYSTSEQEDDEDDSTDSSSDYGTPKRSIKLEYGRPELMEQRQQAIPSLPSFGELLDSIHVEQKSQEIAPANGSWPVVNGFRSAGTSPTRTQRWEKTPPRRIHSMESLSSLLD